MTGLSSPILRASSTLAFFMANTLSLYLLLRGHHAPGGGFIAGLVTASSVVLLGYARGPEKFGRVLGADPGLIAGIGLAVAGATALVPILFGRAALEHFFWILGNNGWSFGTALLFDAGVFLVVVGVTTKVVASFAASSCGLPALVAEEERRYSSPSEEPLEGTRAN